MSKVSIGPDLSEKYVAAKVELAKKIGLDGAIVVTMVANMGEGFHRIPFREWQELLPFYSISKINRLIRGLEESGILEATTSLNESGLDKTKSYRLNQEALRQIEEQ